MTFSGYYSFTDYYIGAFIASGTRALIERLETEQTLRDVWQWFPPDSSGFTVDLTVE